MSERAFTFTGGEFYHIYNRGVDKRKIFFSGGDWDHFQRLLYVRNSEQRIDIDRIRQKSLSEIATKEVLIDIVAYAMMPNHFHLLIYIKKDDVATIFMRRLLTSFSMYMNKKYNRSGPLMCRPFRAKHVDSDEHMRWLFAYIHLNPVDLVEPNWKEEGITNLKNVQDFLCEYKYSSYMDYFGDAREEALLLNKKALPIDISSLEDPKNMLKEYLASELGVS